MEEMKLKHDIEKNASLKEKEMERFLHVLISKQY
jgi:hypothetical protein